MISATAVLPCAGAGRRLGLPYPKELLVVGPGRLLIDDTLDLLRATDAPLDGVVMVVDGFARPTASYAAGRLAGLPVCAALQKAGGTAWTSAVRDAISWLGRRTIVLLPDQVLRPLPGTDPLRWALDALADHTVSFLAHPQPDPKRLASDGALKTMHRHGGFEVVGYAERPGAAAERFDSAWVGVALRIPEGLTALDAMERALSTDASAPPADLRRAGIIGAPVAHVDGYRDLGAWPRVWEHCQAWEAVP